MRRLEDSRYFPFNSYRSGREHSRRRQYISYQANKEYIDRENLYSYGGAHEESEEQRPSQHAEQRPEGPFGRRRLLREAKTQRTEGAVRYRPEMRRKMHSEISEYRGSEQGEGTNTPASRDSSSLSWHRWDDEKKKR